MPDPHRCDRQVHLQTWPCVPGEQRNRSTLRATGPETKRTFFISVMSVLHLWPAPLCSGHCLCPQWPLLIGTRPLASDAQRPASSSTASVWVSGRPQRRVWAGSQSQEHVQAHRPGALALRWCCLLQQREDHFQWGSLCGYGVW